MNMFDRAANVVARLVGHPATFALACLIIVGWGVMGPVAGYSDTWQLIINTSTTIVTFLVVFLIQNTQNRTGNAMHLKLDELLRALDAADTRLCDLEERSERELRQLRRHYLSLANDSDPRNGSGNGAGHSKRSRRRPRNQPARPKVDHR